MDRSKIKAGAGLLPLAFWIGVGVAFPLAALAGDHRFAADNPAWKMECGSCHIAYPPQLLPAASWRALMAGLDRHFGVDAAVDAKDAAEIGAFLERHSGTGRRVQAGSPSGRITETGWFRREHRAIGAAAWSRAPDGSAANCAACHRNAEQGDFGEGTLRLPHPGEAR